MCQTYNADANILYKINKNAIWRQILNSDSRQERIIFKNLCIVPMEMEATIIYIKLKKIIISKTKNNEDFVNNCGYYLHFFIGKNINLYR